MAFDCEGTIYIPKEDFWVWVDKKLTKVEDIADIENTPFVNHKKGVIKFFYRNSGHLAEELDLATFWEFVNEYVPFKDIGAEYEFGIPDFDDYEDVVVLFAASTYCHPADWTDKSKAARQWETLK